MQDPTCEFGQVLVWQCGRPAAWSMTVTGPVKAAGNSVTFYVCEKHYDRCRSSFGPLVDVEVVDLGAVESIAT